MMEDTSGLLTNQASVAGDSGCSGGDQSEGKREGKTRYTALGYNIYAKKRKGEET